MEIYVVKQGDNIGSIADKYGISVQKLVFENGLNFSYNLVVGQALVITYAKETHTVQNGESIQSIADLYNVTPMQLFRNNNYLLDRETIYTGESFVISYDTKGSITINGLAYPFIDRQILFRTLPYLTYISIFNYTITDGGEVIEYYKDADIIETAKKYNVLPLVLISTLTPGGEPNVELAYDLLLDEEVQERNISLVTDVMIKKGYQGVNLVFNYLTKNNQTLYLQYLRRVSERMKKEGFPLILTINYKEEEIDEQINYELFSPYVDNLVFLKLLWGTKIGTPAPVVNISNIKSLVNYITETVPLKQIVIGIPTIAYDWRLQYDDRDTRAVSLSIKAALELAYDNEAVIQFDDVSKTPFFYYDQMEFGTIIRHIVWFIDARSVDELNQLIIENNLNGSGLWNVMTYNQQIITVINSTFDIIKY